MRIVRPICCGADVHKDLIVATIATTNQDGITDYIQSSLFPRTLVFLDSNHDSRNIIALDLL